jgi:hypothetical protein
VKEQGRRDPEGDEVRERVELAAEGAAAPAAAREIPVDGVEHRCDRDGGERPAEAAVGDEHQRHDTGREARARDDVREIDELPHAGAPVAT